MTNLADLAAIALTVVTIPWVIYRIPYFKRADVRARRAAKSTLPQWISTAEQLFFLISWLFLSFLFYGIEARIHRVFHPELAFLPGLQATLSLHFLFWLIQSLAPLAAALPFGGILANLISWSIPAIRKAEGKIIAEGVPGYTWADLNMGLLKFAAIAFPISAILALISLRRL